MIAASALKASRAAIKAMVVNLGPDNDIQGFAASDLVDRALACIGDQDNSHRSMTHILLDNSRPIEGVLHLKPGLLGAYPVYRGPQWSGESSKTKFHPKSITGGR
jgi:hypothetical protein